MEALLMSLSDPMTSSRTPSFPGNLPAPLSTFVGRENEIAEIDQRLASSRLLTIIGPGGAGKTRLALQAAYGLLPTFEDGVWWTELASLSDPTLVPQAVSASLHIHEQTGQTITSTLCDYLRSRKLLLVLDNCEHLIEACAHLTETLLQTCANLHILATSREPLDIPGEVVFTVPPLSLPVPHPWRSPPGEEDPITAYRESEAVRLFVTRALAVSSTFALTPQNGAWIAEICRRLDGIPLAIELAAARVRALSAQQIAERLDDRFALLTGGNRTAPQRHQTLEATLDWSYTLLEEPERKVLQRLSVFAGGCTLEAAEAVCAGDDLESKDILDILSRLVDKSLVAVNKPDSETRYLLLETIRQYANKKLIDAGEVKHVRDHHLDYFVQWVEVASSYLFGQDQLRWIGRFEAEHDNLRAALDWSKKTDESLSTGLKLAAASGRFWRMRGYLSEGREHLSALLAHKSAERYPSLRANALYHLSALAYLQSDYPTTRHFGEESLAIWQALGDAGELGYADVITMLGEVATEEGDYATAPRLFQEALAIYRKLDYKQGIGDILMQLGWAAMRAGDFGQVLEPMKEALVVFRNIGNTRAIGIALAGLGELAIRQGRYEQATTFLEESLALRQKAGEKWGAGTALGSLGWVALRQRDFNRMNRFLEESIAMRMEIGDKGGIAWCLEKLGEATILLGQATPLPARIALYRQAVRNFGAAFALRLPIRSVVDPVDQPEYDRMLTLLRTELGEHTFEESWLEGKAMNLEVVIEDALALLEAPEPPQPELRGGLSPREQEAATWIARGLSNREIAEAMTVRVKTVETYTTRILNKLGFNTRVQIATWVIEKGLETPQTPDKE